MLFPCSVPDTELVLYPLQDKLTSGDKSLDLSAFKLSRLFLSLLSSGSSSCWRSYGAHNSNFTKDPSKVTDIELTDHMIVVNNQKDSVSPPPLVAKPKKGNSQTVASTLPKLQGPEASRALSKKRK
ncbi:hypothetical protein Tco_0930109 [Tanacetum coccineum]